MTREEPFYFPCCGRNLFAVMHQPETSTTGAAFLLCAPFAEEKLWTHLVFVNLARDLAQRGHPVLRFDYGCTGDSDGNFEEATLETYLADIREALGVLSTRTGSVRGLGLIGLRLGASLAALVAEQAPEVERLVMWAPILRGANYMQELLRVNLGMQMAMYKEVRVGRDALVQQMHDGQPANVDGYPITGRMFDEMAALDLLASPRQSLAQCLIVEVVARPAPSPCKEISELRALFHRGTAEVCVEEPFWKEIRPLYARAERLYADTFSWLGRADHDL